MPKIPSVLITVNDKPWLARAISVGSGTRTAEFRETVRQRDQRCVKQTDNPGRVTRSSPPHRCPRKFINDDRSAIEA